jgi:hypothetical protein
MPRIFISKTSRRRAEKARSLKTKANRRATAEMEAVMVRTAVTFVLLAGVLLLGSFATRADAQTCCTSSPYVASTATVVPTAWYGYRPWRSYYSPYYYSYSPYYYSYPNYGYSYYPYSGYSSYYPGYSSYYNPGYSTYYYPGYNTYYPGGLAYRYGYRY